MIIHKVMRISKLQTHCDHSSLKISYFRPNFLQINCCYKCSMIFCVLKLLLHWEICPRSFVWFCRRANKNKEVNGKSESFFSSLWAAHSSALSRLAFGGPSIHLIPLKSLIWNTLKQTPWWHQWCPLVANWMKVGERGWKWMQVDESGWKSPPCYMHIWRCLKKSNCLKDFVETLCHVCTYSGVNHMFISTNELIAMNHLCLEGTNAYEM